MALTDIKIKKAKPSEKPYKLSDSGNLYLWITPTGGRIWRWAYKFEGKAKLMTFGKYPDVPPALARDRHGDGRKLLAPGVDPMAERKAGKVAERVANHALYLKPRTKMMQEWADFLEQTQRGGKVLPIRGTAA